MVTLSCKLTHPMATKTEELESQVQTSKIIFLNYSIKINSSTKKSEIRLINTIIAEGKLKSSPSEPEIRKQGDLLCISLNKNNEPVDSVIISDPLNITVESVDANNTYFKKEIARDSAEFSVRMRLDNNTHAFGIKKNADSKSRDSYQIITKIK